MLPACVKGLSALVFEIERAQSFLEGSMGGCFLQVGGFALFSLEGYSFQRNSLFTSEVIMKKKLFIFASGKSHPDIGGTGAENLAKCLGTNDVDVVIISSHERGSVRKKADRLSVPFEYFPGPYTTKGYQEFVEGLCQKMNLNESDIWYALSGWFRWVYWLHPARTFNIHSAPLPRFAGMWGEGLHRAVWDVYMKGEITESEIVMQFVTLTDEKYDDGPVFFRISVPMVGIPNFEAFKKITHETEHQFQPEITRLVIRGEISWDGVHPESLKVPVNYRYLG